VTGRAWLPHAVLALGVLVVASASILIRYAMQDGAGPLAIAALRLAIASVVLAPFAWGRVRNDLPGLSGVDRTLIIACGVVLALHFATWISSLAYTSVASSAVLVTTNPVWVGLLSWLVLRERPGNVMIGGIALAMAGSALVFGAQGAASGAAPSPLLGNALALAGAVAASIYLLLGRRLRDRLSLLAYVWTVYAVAAVTLLAMAIAAGENLALPLTALGFVTALALGPQLVGHTAFNYAVRHLPAPVVAVAILGEPLGSALLAWMLFDETVGTGQLAGFGVLLAGILLSVLADQRPAVPATAADK
jgi:drug/metabolite transporter (DMT)-like permease